jgi:acyl carrier protein
MSQDRDAAFETFKKCAVEVLQVEPNQVTMEARFGDDLDADSLDLVELVMALEENFDITVDESELEGIETVGQAFDLIASKL